MVAQTYPYGILEEVEASSHKMEKPTDAACAGENMLLAATELGLGSCYLESPTLAFHNPAVCAAVQLSNNIARSLDIFSWCFLLFNLLKPFLDHNDIEKHG